MKNLTLFFTVSVVFLICLSGCNEDDNALEANDLSTGSDGKNGKSVIDVWTLVSVEKKDGQERWDGALKSTYSGTSENESGTIEYRNDKTFFGEMGYKFNLVSHVDGNKVNSSHIVYPTKVSGIYDFDESSRVITVTNSSQDQIILVTTLTTTKMVQEKSVTSVRRKNGVLIETRHLEISTYSR